MTTFLDLIPELNPQTLQWEVRETDEKDNTLEVYSFDSEEKADSFVDGWIEYHDNRSAGLYATTLETEQ
jgi:hypothetical protein